MNLSTWPAAVANRIPDDGPQPRPKGYFAIYQSGGRYVVADAYNTASVRYWVDLEHFDTLPDAVAWAWARPGVVEVVVC